MSSGLEVVRTALAGSRAWLVGGAVRDRALGRASEISDVDIVVDGDPAAAARAVALAAGRAACFALSEQFGAWRVVARDHSWQVDVEPMRGESLAADLALPDLEPGDDRVMVCGSPAMLSDTQALLDRRRFRISPHIGEPGDYVIERAFVEK